MMSTWSRLSFCTGIPERGRDPVPPGRVVVDEVGDPEHTPVGGLHQLKAGLGVRPLPIAQLLEDVLDLPDLVLRALPRIHARDVDDRLLAQVEDLQDVVRVAPGVEEVADVELLQVFVAVQLLVVGVGDGLEPRLVLGHQHGLGIATEVGSRHRHDVGLVACHELADVHAELVVRIGGDVVELVHRDEPFVEGLHPEPVHGEAEGGVRADECPVVATQKRLQGVDLAALGPGGAAEVPLRPDGPVRPEAETAERHVRETRADRLLGNDDDRLAETLVLELVERDEHECPALPRSRR